MVQGTVNGVGERCGNANLISIVANLCLKMTPPGQKPPLTPEQLKRFKQIQYQQLGARAFADPDVQKALKLTDKQRQQLQALQADLRKELAELRKQIQDNPQVREVYLGE